MWWRGERERGGDEREERWEVGRCGRVANTQSVSLGDCQGVKSSTRFHSEILESFCLRLLKSPVINVEFYEGRYSGQETNFIFYISLHTPP